MLERESVTHQEGQTGRPVVKDDLQIVTGRTSDAGGLLSTGRGPKKKETGVWQMILKASLEHIISSLLSRHIKVFHEC